MKILNTIVTFATRDLARAYAKTVNKPVKDNGTNAEKGKRWAVEKPEMIIKRSKSKKAEKIQQLGKTKVYTKKQYIAKVA